jgi:hypothetical protein
VLVESDLAHKRESSSRFADVQLRLLTVTTHRRIKTTVNACSLRAS